MDTKTKPPSERVKRIFDETVGSDLSSWEKFEFLPSIKNRRALSDPQERILAGIEKRVLEEDEE